VRKSRSLFIVILVVVLLCLIPACNEKGEKDEKKIEDRYYEYEECSMEVVIENVQFTQPDKYTRYSPAVWVITYNDGQNRRVVLFYDSCPSKRDFVLGKKTLIDYILAKPKVENEDTRYNAYEKYLKEIQVKQ